MITVPDLLRLRAKVSPQAPAIAVDRGPTLTFGGWDRRSNAVARGLAAQGVAPGDRVALRFDNSRWDEFAVAYVAVHKAGAVAVPLGDRFTDAERCSVTAHCDAALSLGAAELVALEAEWPTDAFQAQLDAASPADILYTSGTTGTPKGVVCTHADVLFGVDLEPGPSPDEVPDAVVHAFPIGTNAGQEAVRLPLRQGGHVAVVLSPFDPERLCALITDRHFRRYHLFLVPAMAQMLADFEALGGADRSAVESVVLTSAPTPPALMPRVAAAFPGARISNVYTLTESGSARTVMVYDPSRPGSVGRPARHAQVRVVDKDGSDRPPGSTGEIWLRHPGAPRREYFRDPDATARRFTGDWLRTGDLGYLDDGGHLFIVDRLDDLIISGGSNVSSIEVEGVLAEHPAVAEAAVIGIRHPVLGQAVGAAVVTRQSEEVTARELQFFVRQRLAEYKTPHMVAFLDVLPRNSSGKVLKRQLRDVLATASTEEVAARNPVEETIVSIWKDVLRTDSVSVDDDFFAAGGHSLAAAQVVSRLEDAFGVKLGPTAVFDAPTVAELAAAVEAAPYVI